MKVASDLFSLDGLRSITIPTGLMWATRMLPGEIYKLMNEDVDFNNRFITINELSKDYSNQHLFKMTWGNNLVLRNFEYYFYGNRDDFHEN